MRLFWVMLILLCLGNGRSYAAFPLRMDSASNTIIIPATTIDTLTISKKEKRFIPLNPNTTTYYVDPKTGREHLIVQKKRSRALTIGIATLIYPYVLGVHRLYLGYTWQGLAQMLSPLLGLVPVGLLALGIGTAGTMAAIGILVAVLAYLAAYIWQLIDVIRIGSRDLQPKWGYYKEDLDKRIK